MDPVPFFEPEPEPVPEQSETQRAASWAPPAWDRPSEGTIPAVVAVSRLFGRTENVALSLDEVRAYPNGFVLGVALQVNPRIPDSMRHPGRFGGRFGTMLVSTREAVAASDDTTSAKPPAPGALDVFAEWSSVGISEARITLDADEIRSAAKRAMVLWS